MELRAVLTQGSSPNVSASWRFAAPGHVLNVAQLPLPSVPTAATAVTGTKSSRSISGAEFAAREALLALGVPCPVQRLLLPADRRCTLPLPIGPQLEGRLSVHEVRAVAQVSASA